ncbi:hypothetical protein EW145_g2627 [Phellinidium pouzarii]|uniref:Uncharacterized protein n=1 Tax=Phellinidium pouzarii TaxID=167371 RepID=A0A4S4LAM7_9AGAM|nr:hypothetical protein EW145_g2627 [Phellinidium pouzarii]
MSVSALPEEKVDKSGPKPTYIYKLVPSSAPVPDVLPECLPVSEIDQNSGFVHLSTALQIPGTLKYFFADDTRVYVLRLKYDDLVESIRWEDPEAAVCGPRAGEGIFPHLYNGLKLGKDEIDSVAVWEKGEDEWDAALRKAESWLVY